jgi:hypothetical protein
MNKLLKEAIADAKVVRTTAILNAKSALEEAFNQRFSAVFADKLREDSAIEDDKQTTEEPMAESADKDSIGATKPSKSDGTKPWSKDNKGNFNNTSGTKNLTPTNIPAGKDGGDGTKPWSKDNKGDIDGTPTGVKENAEEGKEEEDKSVEETVTNEDLDEIIRELEAEAGDTQPEDPSAMGGDVGGEEVPPTDGAETTPTAEGQPIVAGTPVILMPAPAAGGAPAAPAMEPSVSPEPSPEGGAENNPPMEEEEIDLEELLSNLNEESKEKEDKEEHEAGESKEKEDKEEKMDETLTKLNEAISQRNDAYKTVQYLRSQINEINLLNAKLLYTNKLFKEYGMNRDQKTKVVEAFDLTKNVREVKMTFANWCESLNFGGNTKKKLQTASSLSTITEGLTSRPVASTKPTNVITENCNEQARRFQKLAGINVKN